MIAEKTEGKVKEPIDYEDRLTIFDSIILCRFYSDFLGWKELETIINLITGKSLKKRHLQQIAQAITNLVRQYNIQEGVSKKDDSLPKRFFKETLGDGKSIGTAEEFSNMINEYYQARGWDPEGNPSPLQGKLAEKFIADL